MKAVLKATAWPAARASAKAAPGRVDLVTPEHEHEFEASHGLPENLPAGEHTLWQGRPDTVLLARQALHVDAVLLYFGALLAWRGWASASEGAGLGGTLLAMVGLLPIMALALGLLVGLAALMARTTVYTITNRRIVMRVGVVLSITFNLPFSQVLRAGWRPRGQGGSGGDIALSLAEGTHIAYLHLWPHVRPWRLRHTEPMLRALADAPAVAATLAQALQQAESRAQASATAAAPATWHAVHTGAQAQPEQASATVGHDGTPVLARAA